MKTSYIDGVPQGLVCANQGAVDARGRTLLLLGFANIMRYNPVAICDSGSYGYQCAGRSPEAPMRLSTANQESGKLTYQLLLLRRSANPGRYQSDSVGVLAAPDGDGPVRLGNIPLARPCDKSRADLYYQLARPTPAANPATIPSAATLPELAPVGGSCVQDIAVPGCQPGRFRFCLLRVDTPDENYPPMHVPTLV